MVSTPRYGHVPLVGGRLLGHYRTLQDDVLQMEQGLTTMHCDSAVIVGRLLC